MQALTKKFGAQDMLWLLPANRLGPEDSRSWAVARAGEHASFRFAPLRVLPRDATFLRTAWETYRIC